MIPFIPPLPNPPPIPNQAYDDDWDSDFDDGPSASMPPPPPPGAAGAGGAGGTGSLLSVPKNSGQSGSAGDVSSIGRSDSKRGGAAAAAAAAAAGRTSFNRFSTFVKSGGENYVLGKLNANVQESDLITVVVRGFYYLFFSLSGGLLIVHPTNIVLARGKLTLCGDTT